MKRIRELTRPNVMSAHVRQTPFLDILEQPLRTAAASLGKLREDKEEEPED